MLKSYISSMKATDYAYTAGYIDGDGCFFVGEIKTSPFFQDTFSIISTHFDNIEWFKSRFNGSIHTKKSKQKNRVPSYHFVFTKEGYEDLFKIRPYLVEKQQECDVFLKFRDPIFKNERNSLLKSMSILKNESYLIPKSIKESVEAIKNTVVPTEIDFAYLAGFIDAECSLDINQRMQKRGKNPTYRPQLQCNNTKSPFFYWASARFGGQFHFLDKSHIKNCRNQMIWRISNLQLDPILKGVYPFLVHKKPICELMIKLRQLTIPRKNLDLRKEIYEKVRHLNNPII